MKKLVTLMLALAMIISAVGVLAEADGKITIWTWDPTFNIKAMQIAKEMYLKDHPDAVIDIQEKLSEDIETAVIASNGDTSTLPDILLVQDNSFQKFVTNYPEVYADLTGKYDYEGFAQGKLAYSIVDGKNHGIPFDAGTAVAAYRTDYLEAAGYTAADLKDITWERFIEIGRDVKAKTGGKTVGVTFPILSRNRFSLLLSGIAAGVEKVVLMLSYPSDEVGNHLVSLDQLDEAGIDPWHDVLDLEQFRAAFGKVIHPFTGVDYVDFYKGIIEDAGAQAEIVFANRVQTVLDYTDTVICCDIHTRQRSKRLLKKAGARVVLGLDDLLTAPVNGSGYNPQYGLLGSNKADDTRVKLFPRDADVVAEAIGQRLSEATGKRIEAMVYGDGAFKDPVGKIWELADPVVSPGYTAGLEGTPNELKLKYLADHDFGDLSGEALQQAVAQKIREKDASVSLVGNMVSEGTTPRHLTDLIGSLCDLTSGSGDKGTPVIYIQGYFDNYTND